MPGNKVVQTLRVGSTHPGAEVQAGSGVLVAQGQPGPAAKTQIAPALGHPAAHGLQSVRPQGLGLEPGVAAGNQQQGSLAGPRLA